MSIEKGVDEDDLDNPCSHRTDRGSRLDLLGAPMRSQDEAKPPGTRFSLAVSLCLMGNQDRFRAVALPPLRPAAFF